MSTNYDKGARFEYKVQAKLEKLGYVVARTAGSHSSIDLIAIPSRKQSKYILLIQCKWSSNNLNINSVLRGLDVYSLINLSLDKPLRDVVQYVVMIKHKGSRKIQQFVYNKNSRTWKQVQII